jgi:hypothetical protein
MRHILNIRMGRSGTADLPLHGGRVPAWLALRMARLGRVITEAMLLEHGRDELLRRLASPFWFQSFGAVMGMDWHSSGITTSVLGALKRGLAGAEDELGLWVCGGRGRHSRKTPAELVSVGEKTGLDGAALARTSRLVAKVDSAAVQDGFQLYLHGFIVAADGKWTVVQQGMNLNSGHPARHGLAGATSPRSPRLAAPTARRYHWLSGVPSFVEEPHAAIEGVSVGEIVNLTDRRAPRRELVALAESPDRVLDELRLPAHHDVRPSDVSMKRLRGTLAAAAAAGPRDFAELLLVPGVGARTVRSLALVAEVLHGTPSRFRDPARFSLAHGGKDGHPYPVPTKVFDQTIRVLKDAVSRAKLGNDERMATLRRLDREARRLEAPAPDDLLRITIEHEWAQKETYGGRTVMDDRRRKDERRRKVDKPAQLELDIPACAPRSS